jgi:hypothetical protein
MAAPTVNLGSINLNNGTTHKIDPSGMNLGQRQTEWDEEVSYAGGSNVQVNVRRGKLILVTIPLTITGSSVANLKVLLDALWVEVDKATNTLTLDGESYSIVYSTRPDIIERDSEYENVFRAHFTLTLTRTY